MNKQMILSHAVKAMVMLLLSASFCYGDSDKTTFTKLDAQGKSLPDNAETWSMVRDNSTQLVWEVKTDDGSVHDKNNTYTYEDAEEKLIGELNRTSFGGFSDWRMPSNDELYSIRIKGAEPYINNLYFPHTVATSYHSWRLCGTGEIFNEKVKFGKKRMKGKLLPARAVRGKNE